MGAGALRIAITFRPLCPRTHGYTVPLILYHKCIIKTEGLGLREVKELVQPSCPGGTRPN